MGFLCTVCKIEYKSFKSLWNHNNKFHSDLNIKLSNKKITGDFECEKCDKTFTRKDNMITHMKTKCKNIDGPTKTEKLEKELIELKNELKELKSLTTANGTVNTAITNGNVNNGTVNNATVNNAITNGNVNNGTVNNIIYINKVGDENILELTKKEIGEILNKGISGVVTYVEKVNFNERLPSNHSFCNTNLDSAYLSVYDTEKLKPIKDRKKYFFEEVISKAVTKMEELYKINKGHFKKEKQKDIESTLERLNELKSMTMSKRILKEMIKKLNILSYNDKDVIQNTWTRRNIQKKVKRTFEEDLEIDSDEEEDITDLFINNGNENNHFTEADSDYESASESEDDSEDSVSERKQLKINKIIK